MSSGRLGSFRSGDRSEYLATYALSRVAYVTPVPRQEDFGVVDCLCVLARSDAHTVFPESAFYVQIKSNRTPMVWEGVAIKWLAEHMAHPLFICVVDKDSSRVSLYSCSVLWSAVLRSRVPPERIRVSFDGAPAASPVEETSLHYEANLGPPVLQQSVEELETSSETAYNVLKGWISLDAANISLREIGRVVSRSVASWETNMPPDSSKIVVPYWFGPHFPLVERDIAPLLTALAHNYHDAGQGEKLRLLADFLATIPEHLDGHGRDCASGKWTNS